MAGRYAARTQVTVAKSKMEIEQLVARYGADQFVSGYDVDRAFVMFRAHGRGIRFVVATPPGDQQEERRLWRCLLLSIKSKLEVVESGIATFEEEFLAHTVLPDGRTFAEWAEPQLDAAVGNGWMPSGLLALGSGADDGR
jgi:hypothetical protein